MKRKAKLYGPVLLAALLCALVFATGALKKPKIFENITTDYMVFQKKLPRYSLSDGDEYGVIPMERRGWMHLPAGEYRLRWTISCDGDNILRLTNTNDATITPSEFTIPAGAGDGELHFTVEEDCEDFKIEFEFAAGTYMDIYQVKLYTPEYQDDAFTLLFFAVGASILWLMIGTGRLTRENMAPVLFIALAVLIGSAPALKTTFVIGHDGTYHMARLLNLADGLKNGQFPVRMGGFAYDGYGGVMSVFYPDTFLYPFALMILGGASAVYVCNVFSVALNIGAALSMYVAAKRLFEKRWAATGASILYTLASYRVVNVFTRIAFGEALAMIFLPLFLVNVRRGLRRRAALEGTGAQRGLHLLQPYDYHAVLRGARGGVLPAAHPQNHLAEAAAAARQGRFGLPAALPVSNRAACDVQHAGAGRGRSVQEHHGIFRRAGAGSVDERRNDHAGNQ